MPHNQDLQLFKRSLGNLTGSQRIAVLTQTIRGESRKHIKAYCLLQVRGSRSSSVVAMYREVLASNFSVEHECVLINVDLDNLAQVVGIQLIQRFLEDKRWVVSARAACILYQHGTISLSLFDSVLACPRIRFIDKSAREKYASYLRRRAIFLRAKNGIKPGNAMDEC